MITMYGMRFEELVRVLNDERQVTEFLYRRRKSLCPVACPFCGRRRFYVMGRKRLRCKKCRRDHDFLERTWFGGLRIGYGKWMMLIKLFELEVSARKARAQLSLSYPTVHRAFGIMRQAIAHELAKRDRELKGEIEADESYFGGKRKGRRGRGAGGKTIVFGILERGGKVSVSIVRDAGADSLLGETIRKVRRGSIVYTDKWKGYDSLMFCGYRHLNIDHKHKFKLGKVYINGVEGFWSFAKERLAKHHGVSPGNFLYYLKEQEWRYNHRDRNLFELLVNYMLGAVN
jgi:transposase